MKEKRILFLHTGLASCERVRRWTDAHSPAFLPLHLLDERILPEIKANGNLLSSATARRVGDLLKAGESLNADAIVTMCTAIGHLVYEKEPGSHIPLLVPEALAIERAMSLYQRIAVLITAETTRNATACVITAAAGRCGFTGCAELFLAEGAFACLQRGDAPEHDRLIAEKTNELLHHYDCVVLAQASMTDARNSAIKPERVIPGFPCGMDRLTSLINEAPDRKEGTGNE